MAGLAVIIGASGATGSEVCRRLNEEGWKLVIAARGREKLESLAEELDEAKVVEADARKPEDVARLFEEASEMGEISAAVNCAGSVFLKPAHLTSDEEWEDTVDLNLNTSFYVLREAVKKMKAARKGGSIVFCSSAAAQIGLPNHEAIAAAKGGIISLVRSAAATYAPAGIRVNAVAPGLVRAGMSERLVTNEASLKTSLKMHPLGRIGEGTDTSRIITMLMGEDAGWITGQVFTVDGGLSSLKLAG